MAVKPFYSLPSRTDFKYGMEKQTCLMILETGMAVEFIFGNVKVPPVLLLLLLFACLFLSVHLSPKNEKVVNDYVVHSEQFNYGMLGATQETGKLGTFNAM
ncbi:hypothetical protein CEXT_60701 [Caerostris extrusa]|uniref:ATP synthase F0 subunit 8 n=1 Tax=Caerostris extrusa TaxID=172846 RepID=A0AAV4XEA4_CAEEX|nr:hypothetical protein CEXT_60701 [Caerostris extrusa]